MGGCETPPKVTLKDFVTVKEIGRGTYGTVTKVMFKGDQQFYAMKAYRKDVLIRENMVKNANEEKNILQGTDHPFIVKLHFAFQNRERLFLVLDFLPGGELFSHLHKEGKFPVARTRLYAAEIVCALRHLHDRGIVHCDLKPENIVLDRNGHVCLTDMGLAKIGLAKSNEQDVYLETCCQGTLEYMAPEILKGTGHNHAIDWWACGILIYEMLVGLPPFYSDDMHQMYDFILNKPLEFTEDVPESARDLITKLLDRDENKRLADGEAILNHPFFAPLELDKVMRKEVVPEWVPECSG
jgi:serine/threonine protein kinase|mmetsp:Transcript_7596/g.14516  ORF Transcript_7596/g.14516 Transcript_7596/m.14516 type:complete len:297 (+) Transcript_7596:77-967(+)